MRSGPHIMSPCVCLEAWANLAGVEENCAKNFSQSVLEKIWAHPMQQTSVLVCASFQMANHIAHRMNIGNSWSRCFLECMNMETPLVPMSAYTCEPLRQQLCHNVPQWWTQCVSLVSMDACEQKLQHQGCVFFLDLFVSITIFLSFLITLIQTHVEIQRSLICFGYFILMAAQTCFVWILMAGHVLSEQICFVRRCRV